MSSPNRSTIGASFRFVSALAIAGVMAVAPGAFAQTHVHAEEPTSATPRAAASAALLHMEMTPVSRADRADSLRALEVARTLRVALAEFADTAAAVAAGYKMFAPQLKQQKVYHFTNNWRAVQEGFRFEPSKPTSLLYRKEASGRFVLVGAMYTAPKRFDHDKLDERVPLSIARWHKHVNLCMPRRGETRRWLERIDGKPVFGPESPIASKQACDLVNGNFHETLFGWMLHANVFAGDDLGAIWGDEHAGHDMHDAMKS